MALLRYIFGNVTDFEALGVDVSTTRRSKDGLQTFVHQENLNDYQMFALLTQWKDGAPFGFISDNNPDFASFISTNYETIEGGE